MNVLLLQPRSREAFRIILDQGSVENNGLYVVMMMCYVFDPELANLAWRRVSRTPAREGSMSAVRHKGSESVHVFFRLALWQEAQMELAVGDAWASVGAWNIFHARVVRNERHVESLRSGDVARNVWIPML